MRVKLNLEKLMGMGKYELILKCVMVNFMIVGVSILLCILDDFYINM